MNRTDIEKRGIKIYDHMKDIKADFASDAPILNKFYNKKQMFKWLAENNDDYAQDCDRYNFGRKSTYAFATENGDTNWSISAWNLTDVDTAEDDWVDYDNSDEWFDREFDCIKGWGGFIVADDTGNMWMFNVSSD